MDKKTEELQEINIFWFRRDLRIDDNLGLFKALQGKFPLLPVFIFDTEILDQLSKSDARVTFIYETVENLRKEFQKHGSDLLVLYGRPSELFIELQSQYQIQHIIANRDYEPKAIVRDTYIQQVLTKNDIGFHTFKDQVVFEQNEIVKDDGKPYVVYTPYMKKWKQVFRNTEASKDYNPWLFINNLLLTPPFPTITLEAIGFSQSSISVEPYSLSKERIANYETTRNFPSQSGTSRLGPHLRFGTISIRKAIAHAIAAKNEVFWQELIWREFFMQILWHFPHTTERAFRPKYDRILWRNNELEFQKWTNGQTGFPLVDAGMRELNQTGYMHNRVRMLVASFLCKHLLIDWRWGEAYFASKLLDYEQSSNVGNWQWAAGTGVDAAPYFRIFNPTTQIQKFDKNLSYIRQWVQEFDTQQYPEPMVDHKMARARCLETYKAALQ